MISTTTLKVLSRHFFFSHAYLQISFSEALYIVPNFLKEKICNTILVKCIISIFYLTEILLYCLFFIDIRLLIIFLIFSNFSCDRIENTEGAIKKKDNRKKLATLGTQDEKKTKTKTQHNICWVPLYAIKHK